MKTQVIMKSWKSLPMEMINVILFLFPVAVILYYYEVSLLVFLLMMVYSVFVIGVGVYVIYSLRFPPEMILSDAGVQFKHEGFYEWKVFETYRIEETISHVKTEEGNMIYTRHTLMIDLADGSSLHISADQLDQKPAQLILLFEQRKSRAVSAS